jgi:hypothetical protein
VQAHGNSGQWAAQKLDRAQQKHGRALKGGMKHNEVEKQAVEEGSNAGWAHNKYTTSARCLATGS